MPVNPPLADRYRADQFVKLSMRFTENAFSKYFKYFLEESATSLTRSQVQPVCAPTLIKKPNKVQDMTPPAP